MPDKDFSYAADLRFLSWSRAAGSIDSDGAYLKAVSGDKSVYYKMSAYNSAQGVYGHETINELLAYRVAVEFGVPVPATTLQKSLVLVDGLVFETYLAVSESYKHARETRVSYDTFYKSVRTPGESAFSTAVRFGWEPRIYQMYFYDFLIFNRDRHGANLEVIDNNGNKRLSPLFDNGLSFAVSCHTDMELEKFDVLADRQVNNFIGSRSLYENLHIVPETVIAGFCKKFNTGFRDKLFYGLDKIMTSKHMDTVWELINKRLEYARRRVPSKGLGLC